MWLCYDMARPRRTTVEARLLRRVLCDVETQCWNWMGGKNKGYGQISLAAGATDRTHRVSYRLFVEPLRPDLEIHHSCGNRACCNPAHLVAVDDLQHKRLDANSMVSRTHCTRGHPLSGENLSPARLRAGKRICRVCASVRFAKHRERDLEAYRQYQREYQKARRERMKASSHEGPPA